MLALRRAHALLVEPGKAVVRDLTPAVVDGQRVTSIAEDLVFVDRRGLGVLLERAVRTGFRDCAILAAADHQEWPAAGVEIYCSGAVGREVGECCLEQRPTRAGIAYCSNNASDSSLDTALAKDLWNDSLLCEYAFR